MASSAPVQWAQRGDSIYLTIVLPDVQDAKIDLTEDKLVFSGVSNGKEFKADLEFFEAVDPKAEVSDISGSSDTVIVLEFFVLVGRRQPGRVHVARKILGAACELPRYNLRTPWRRAFAERTGVSTSRYLTTRGALN